MKQTIKTFLITATLATCGLADSEPYREPVAQKKVHAETVKTYNFKDESYFRANETSVDLFGSFSAANGNGLYRDGFGGGLGVNHFFTKYLGLGLDGYWWDGDRTGEVISSLSASAIFRYPIDKINLAPYVFAGVGGHLASTEQVSGHGGIGLEYRFTRNVGVFADGRYVLTDETNDFGLTRVGVRYAF